jgi:hypothetical protein
MTRKTWIYKYTQIMNGAWGLPLDVGKWYVREPFIEGDEVSDQYASALYSEGPFDSRDEAGKWVEDNV